MNIGDAASAVHRDDVEAHLVRGGDGAQQYLPASASFNRLVAPSVTTMATFPATVSSKPSLFASWTASRRASPGWLESTTGILMATLTASTL